MKSLCSTNARGFVVSTSSPRMTQNLHSLQPMQELGVLRKHYNIMDLLPQYT